MLYSTTQTELYTQLQIPRMGKGQKSIILHTPSIYGKDYRNTKNILHAPILGQCYKTHGTVHPKVMTSEPKDNP
uniref:Uncharacterized protein n=1 Tax=Anguilla anguilla TaxID=7936 RepID=A0A0E9WE95_ANGAN